MEKCLYPYDAELSGPRSIAFLEMLRSGVLRDTPRREILGLAERLPPCGFRAFIHTIAIHEVVYVSLADLEINGSDIEIISAAAGRGNPEFDFARGDFGSVYTAFPGDGGVRIKRRGDREFPGEEEYEGLEDLLFGLTLDEEERFLPVEYLSVLNDELENIRVRAIFTEMDTHSRMALERENSGLVGFLPLGERVSAGEPGKADVHWPGAFMMRGRDCDVLFVPENGHEKVMIRFHEDGREEQVDLPSKIRYRDMADLSPGGDLLAVVSHTRARVVELGTLRSTLAMEGPWMMGVACISRDHMAILTKGGSVQLDLGDPDVRELASVKALERISGSVTVGCSPMLHILDMRGATSFSFSVRCVASTIRSVMKGRVLVLRRHPPDDGSWGTVVLGADGGSLAILAKYPRDIGRIFERDGCVYGERGFKLLGLDKALESMVPVRLRDIRDDMEIGPPPAPSPREVSSLQGRVRLELASGKMPGNPLPAAGREALSLSEGDWLPESTGNGFFPVLRAGGGRYTISLGRVEGDSVVEIPLDRELTADTMMYEFSCDGEYMLIAMHGGNYLVGTADGGTEPATPQNRFCTGAAMIDRDSFMILSRIDEENSQLDVWRRAETGWKVEGSLPTHSLDALFYLHSRRLVLLSFRYMPSEKSLTVVMKLTEDLVLRPVDILLLKTKEAWSEGDRSFLLTDEGIPYELCRVSDAADLPAVSLKYVPHGDGAPPELLLNRSGDEGCRFGYIDSSGSWAVPPAFCSAWGYSGHSSAVGLYPHCFKGLVDRHGAFILPAHSSWIGEDSEGFRRIAYASYSSSEEPADALFGMLDRDGVFVLGPEFPVLGDMREGRAVAGFMDGDHNWVTADGIRLTKESFQACGHFTEACAWVMMNGRYGFVDLNGRHLTGFRFGAALPFSCGVAGVTLQGNKWRFIDRDGKVVSTKGYDEFHSHADGLACVRRDSGWGYVDTRGNEPFGMEFDRTYTFNSGLGAVVRGGKWNFLTLEGELISDSGWEGAFLPAEGMGAYRQNGLFGYANSSGAIVTGPVFASAYPFREGLSAVEVDGKWGYIDTSGEMAIEPRFARVMDFSQGMAPARESRDGPWGYIDRTGLFVIEPKFTHAFVFSNGFAVVGY
ncbi:MAG: WG repeat-containing protein [Candidatus Fermentibacteraceae bacterium]|nr:WG repeat-containing protein [Candidatus Fermentibacteraceae bacterium]MBN2607504.1 WG repeat-containing protein [Candidatus Fermentibacteraceae bacterium]